MRYALIVYLMLSSIIGSAQFGDPPMSAYRYNLFPRNPAAAGAFFDLEGIGQIRTAFNTDQAPFLSTLSLYTNADQLHGAIGVNMQYYWLGASGEQNVSVKAAYNYRMTIDDFDIRIGASGGILTKGTKTNLAVQFPGQNPYVYQTEFVFDAGIFVQNNDVWVGLSATNINEPLFIEPQYNQFRTLYGSAGLKVNQGEVWEFDPSVMIGSDRSRERVDGNLGIRYLTKFVGGVGFRMDLYKNGFGVLTTNGVSQRMVWALFRLGFEDHGFRFVYSIDRPNVLAGTFSYHEFTMSVMMRKDDDPYVKDYLEE